MWIEYQPNPKGHRVGDCSVRAISKALDVDWDTAFCLITTAAFAEKDMPSSDAIWGSVLKRNGFKRQSIASECENCYSAEDFCADHPRGIFVLGFGGHVATVVNSNLYDSWDSSKETPQYYWTLKKDVFE